MEYKMLFTPMNIGTVQIKNRVVMPPMMLGFGQFNGCPTKEMMDYYEERAIGGAGLIITEITELMISVEHRLSPNLQSATTIILNLLRK